jgi:hypothetical protein
VAPTVAIAARGQALRVVERDDKLVERRDKLQC